MEPEEPDTVDVPHQMTDLEAWALSGHLLGAEMENDPHILRGLE
ncbi:hypothetical protein Lesp02_73890 [Lentzea sp. NBRC 105346]|nr:hypothetical protein [Lentzea sp. NBRC 105346]GLZ35202.1 hypothetical protein Lesp02_73890 [Lentzea sp. NBRC 105346]